MGTPNREPQEYSRNMVEYKDPIVGIFPCYSFCILGVHCLGFPVKSLYSLFNCPDKRLSLLGHTFSQNPMNTSCIGSDARHLSHCFLPLGPDPEPKVLST